ncbi:hypothetical protein [Vibrio quintilis]|uniref:Uncharacterized protein n=1 Tax=Vibrio quintilis TaxID=1117707 RepID=A0A1M7Z0Z9_9VIBR|nr:hypothetical protein [Vibrio quintilis]SHO58515.1 hypothetical protein VQ7734_04287 [Vibrio quintilis]
MKREINYKEYTTEAAAFVAFVKYLERDTEAAACVGAAQMIKHVCRLRLVDHRKIDSSEYQEFGTLVKRDGLYAAQLYKEIISLREIPVSLSQPKQRFLAQAERIFFAVLEHVGRDILDDEVADIELVLAKLHFQIERLKEDDKPSSAHRLQSNSSP